MQISPTPPQLHVLKEIWDWIVWPLSGWIFRKTHQAIKSFIVANVNRVRDEAVAKLQTHIDEKFKEHEQNAFVRLDVLEVTVQTLQKDVQILMGR